MMIITISGALRQGGGHGKSGWALFPRKPFVESVCTKLVDIISQKICCQYLYFQSSWPILLKLAVIFPLKAVLPGRLEASTRPRGLKDALRRPGRFAASLGHLTLHVRKIETTPEKSPFSLSPPPSPRHPPRLLASGVRFQNLVSMKREADLGAILKHLGLS